MALVKGGLSFARMSPRFPRITKERHTRVRVGFTLQLRNIVMKMRNNRDVCFYDNERRKERRGNNTGRVCA